MGIIYYIKGEKNTALKCYYAALEMYKNGYQDNDVATSDEIQYTLHNIVQLAHSSSFDFYELKRKSFDEYSRYFFSLKPQDRITSMFGNATVVRTSFLTNLDSLEETEKLLNQFIQLYHQPIRGRSRLGFNLQSALENVYAYFAATQKLKNQSSISQAFADISRNYYDKIPEGLYTILLGWRNLVYAKNAYIAGDSINYLKYRDKFKYYNNKFKQIYEGTNFNTPYVVRGFLDYYHSIYTNREHLDKDFDFSLYEKDLSRCLEPYKRYSIVRLNSIVDYINQSSNLQKKYYKELTNAINYHITQGYYSKRIKAESLYKLSKLYQSINLDTAIHYCENALLVLTAQKFNNIPLAELHEKENPSSNAPLYATILHHKATLLYFLPKNDLRQQDADKTLVLAEQVADLALSQLKNNYDRVEFLSTIRRINHTRFRIEKEKGNIVSAFEIIERNRARILFLHYAEQKANQLNQIPLQNRLSLDSLTALGNELEIQINLLRAKTKPTPEEEAKIESLTRHKIVCEETRLNILQKIERKILQYTEGLKDKPNFNLNEFSNHFFAQNQNKAILEYFQTEDSLHIFCLTRLGLKFKTISINDSVLNALAESFSAIIADSFIKYIKNSEKSKLVYNSFLKESTELYRLLIEPFADVLQGKKLIIVPDGVIWKIPVEALLEVKSVHKNKLDSLVALDQEEELNAYRQLPYLVKNHSIERRLSLQNPLVMEFKNYQYDLVAFAPVFEDKKLNGINPSTTVRSFFNSIQLHSPHSLAVRSSNNGQSLTITPLPETKNEVNEIKYLLNKNSAKVKVYLQEEASEKNFKLLTQKSIKYLHVATHAFANINQPNMSGLIFSPQKNVKEDGVLYAGEIQALKYPTYLVTLSACETGLGKVVSGEGILGLMYGFMQSGAQNVVSSSWTVNDRATSQLMTGMYTHLETGLSPSQALRESQLKMLSAGYGAPYFWAGFTTYGMGK